MQKIDGDARIVEPYKRFKPIRQMDNQISVVEVYLCLGALINEKMNMKDAFKFMRRKLNFLAYAFHPIRFQDSSLRFNQNFWNTFSEAMTDYFAVMA